jgi:hypothetical protein
LLVLRVTEDFDDLYLDEDTPIVRVTWERPAE